MAISLITKSIKEKCFYAISIFLVIISIILASLFNVIETGEFGLTIFHWLAILSFYIFIPLEIVLIIIDKVLFYFKKGSSYFITRSISLLLFSVLFLLLFIINESSVFIDFIEHIYKKHFNITKIHLDNFISIWPFLLLSILYGFIFYKILKNRNNINSFKHILEYSLVLYLPVFICMLVLVLIS